LEDGFSIEKYIGIKKLTLKMHSRYIYCLFQASINTRADILESEATDLDSDLEYWLQLALDFNPFAKSSKKK